MQVIGAGIEGVALGQAVKAQGAQHHRLEPPGPQHGRGRRIAPHHGKQHQPRCQNGTAGEAAAGGQVAVEKNIDAEHQDHRNEKLAHGGHDGVRGIVHHVGLEKPAPFAGAVEQDGHGAHGGEQHKGFAQGIEGTVVQDHAGHGVYRAGLLGALVSI